MKSNIEYLKESLSAKNEWLIAVEVELLNYRKQIESKDDEIGNHLITIFELEVELNNNPGLKTIDCGIGIIEYVQPDNLKLQMIMDDFKEKHSVHAC